LLHVLKRKKVVVPRPTREIVRSFAIRIRRGGERVMTSDAVKDVEAEGRLRGRERLLSNPDHTERRPPKRYVRGKTPSPPPLETERGWKKKNIRS